MAKRKTLIDLTYHYEDSTVYKEGDLDVGISTELDKYIEKYGKDKIYEIFDFIILELLGRFIRFNGTDELKKLYEKIKKLILKELNNK